ncbi:MAG: tRNA synthetase RNA-binding protein [Friedmanniella sp.]|nr:tRNA synthetase RNA-binding protein [Friedmanniella sp.]
MSRETQDVRLTEGIRLGQLLKFSGLADTGAGAREVLLAGEVTVNGEVETRRGRQLAPGDEVSLAGRTVRLVREA